MDFACYAIGQPVNTCGTGNYLLIRRHYRLLLKWPSGRPEFTFKEAVVNALSMPVANGAGASRKSRSRWKALPAQMSQIQDIRSRSMPCAQNPRGYSGQLQGGALGAGYG